MKKVCRTPEKIAIFTKRIAKEAIELYLESCRAHNELIPQELGIKSLTVTVREPVA